MKMKNAIAIFVILLFYSALYVATSYQVPCEGDCELVSQISQKIRKNRESYIVDVSRCSRSLVSDTLCMYVKDTTGVDWNMIADSTCYYANQVGLRQQKVFILKNSLSADTLAKRQCP